MGETAQRLQVYMLGPFQVTINGEKLPNETWKSKRALLLFQYLLTRRGEKVPRDVLLDLLWADESAEESNSKLHTTVYMLRRTLEPGLKAYRDSTFIRHSNGMYWFNDNGACWIDADAFEALVHKSELLEGDNPVEALAVCEQALALYRGDFLPEARYEDWTVDPRERFLELYVETTLRASNLLVSLNANYTDAVRVCRNALARDPYREEIHQAIMSHLVKAGRYAEAAAQYRQCTNMLSEEFGLRPSPETQALFNQMTSLTTKLPSDLRGANVGSNATGPLICDRAMFDSIHAVVLRRQKRDGQPASLLCVQLKDMRVTAEKQTTILKLLQSTLRQGDVVCWDDVTILIQLDTGKAGSEIVRRRIERILSQVELPMATVSVQVFEGPTEVQAQGSQGAGGNAFQKVTHSVAGQG